MTPAFNGCTVLDLHVDYNSTIRTSADDELFVSFGKAQ
jgi:hypothetical protein